MSALENRRHEVFAREMAFGAAAAEAYRHAGYASTGATVEASAMRLAANPEVTRRIAEIAAEGQAPPAATETAEGPGARSALPAPCAEPASSGEVTVESILSELEQARQLALAKKLPAPAITATLSKAKIAGLMAESPPSRKLTFEGSDTEAARRVAYLLGIAGIEPPAEDQP